MESQGFKVQSVDSGGARLKTARSPRTTTSSFRLTVPRSGILPGGIMKNPQLSSDKGFENYARLTTGSCGNEEIVSVNPCHCFVPCSLSNLLEFVHRDCKRFSTASCPGCSTHSSRRVRVAGNPFNNKN
jgi:hypothetical protein